MAKILIISPVPTHPPIAGHRARVLAICLLLKEKGYDLDFLYLHRGKGEGIETTKKFFGADNFYNYQASKRKYKTAFHPLFFQLAKKNIISPNNIFNYSVDYWFEEGMIPVVQELIKEHHYQAVIASYVFYSKFFDYIPSTVKKIIDTHDKFTDRWKILYNADIVPHWFSTSADEEGRGLNRSDLVIAIQKNEAQYFRSICTKKVIALGNKVAIKSTVELNISPVLLFIASDNAVNIQAVDTFLETVFPPLLAHHATLKLYLAGSICTYLQKKGFKHDAVELVGYVEHIEDFYQKGNIVVNPILSGTGLKIKNIEALAYGKYLVTTTCGAEGMEIGINKAFFVGNTPEELIHHIRCILEQIEIRQQLKQGIQTFVKEWNRMYEMNAEELIQLIEST